MTSFLVTLFTFSVMYIPLSIVHKVVAIQEAGILYLFIALLFLPLVHSLMHVLPLIATKKHTRIIFKAKHGVFPFVDYYTRKYLTKWEFTFALLAPTVFITVPGIIASYLVPGYYVYILLLTSVHIGMTFQDFLYIFHLAKAPKKAFVENGSSGIDILKK